MSRLATSFVLGYHGCDQNLASAVIAGQAELEQSKNEFDWLGHGIYFWEADPQRAHEFAKWRADRGELKKPAVVGAIIDLRQCLDLTNREDLDLVRSAHEEYVKEQRKSDLQLAKNKPGKSDPFGDLVLRYLDCAVINFLHHMLEKEQVEPFDTVRGMFTEGGPLYEGAGFQSNSHCQIAVRNTQCILGYFRPRQPEPEAMI